MGLSESARDIIRRNDDRGGELQFTLPRLAKVPPISRHGNMVEIIGKFGSADQPRNAVNQQEALGYAAYVHEEET
jgi:hypothetical protein